MGHFKIQTGDYVIGINTINQVDGGNITEEEYITLATLFRNMPNGKVIKCNNDGSFSYVDNPNPPDPDPELDDSEAFDIILGGAS